MSECNKMTSFCGEVLTVIRRRWSERSQREGKPRNKGWPCLIAALVLVLRERRERLLVCLEPVPLPGAHQAAGIRLVPLFLDPGKWVPWVVGVSVQSQC